MNKLTQTLKQKEQRGEREYNIYLLSYVFSPTSEPVYRRENES